MLDSRHSELATLNAKLGANNPQRLLKQKRQTAKYLSARLQQAWSNLLIQKKSQLSNAARTMNAISPLQTLERGYSITLNADGEAITSSEQVKQDDIIETRLHRGRIISKVSSCIENDS